MNKIRHVIYKLISINYVMLYNEYVYAKTKYDKLRDYANHLGKVMSTDKALERDANELSQYYETCALRDAQYDAVQEIHNKLHNFRLS